LLHRLSPDLLDISFTNYLESLQTSTALALPLDLPEDALLEQKLRAGRDETASRALEVAEVQAVREVELDEALKGRMFGASVAGLLTAMGEGNREDIIRVWEDGLRRMLGSLRDREQAPEVACRTDRSLRFASILNGFCFCHFRCEGRSLKLDVFGPTSDGRLSVR